MNEFVCETAINMSETVAMMQPIWLASIKPNHVIINVCPPSFLAHTHTTDKYAQLKACRNDVPWDVLLGTIRLGNPHPLIACNETVKTKPMHSWIIGTHTAATCHYPTERG